MKKSISICCQLFIGLVFIGLAAFGMYGASMASAQIPQPQTPQENASPVPAMVPDFDASVSGDYQDDDGIEREAYGGIKLTPRALAETQRLHQSLRQQELAAGGFRWMSWEQAGEKVWDFVYKRDPRVKQSVDGGAGKFMDIAVMDIDHDRDPDIILWYWSDCGSEGCLFTLYFANELKKPRNYVARIIRPYESGIMVDNGYFKF